MKRIGMFGMAALSLLSCAAAAEASETAKLKAYKFSLRCFTVNTVSTGDKRYNPNGQNDAQIKDAAYRSYNAAKTMGQQLGYSAARIESDVTQSGNVDGALMLRDDAYFQRARAECSKLGML